MQQPQSPWLSTPMPPAQKCNAERTVDLMAGSSVVNELQHLFDTHSRYVPWKGSLPNCVLRRYRLRGDLDWSPPASSADTARAERQWKGFHGYLRPSASMDGEHVPSCCWRATAQPPWRYCNGLHTSSTQHSQPVGRLPTRLRMEGPVEAFREQLAILL